MVESLIGEGPNVQKIKKSESYFSMPKFEKKAWKSQTKHFSVPKTEAVFQDRNHI